MRRLLGLAVVVAALVGCSTGAHPAAPTPAATEPVITSPAVAAARSSAPTHLAYPAVGVDADLNPTGLNRDGTIAVPPLDRPLQVAYLAWSTALAPGRPTVLVSHVSGRSSAGEAIPGGFFRLHEAKAGDRIDLTGSDGNTVAYRVTDVAIVPKSNFPTSIYDPRPTPTLVLITCTGRLVDRSFDSNALVTAVAT